MRQLNDIFQLLQENNCQLKILCPVKNIIYSKGKTEAFSNKSEKTCNQDSYTQGDVKGEFFQQKENDGRALSIPPNG